MPHPISHVHTVYEDTVYPLWGVWKDNKLRNPEGVHFKTRLVARLDFPAAPTVAARDRKSVV